MNNMFMAGVFMILTAFFLLLSKLSYDIWWIRYLLQKKDDE